MWDALATFILGRPVARQLPDQVRRAIARQQAEAEVLISWAQLLLLLFFLVLYTLAPKTSDGTPFHPVPWVLGAFLVFTLARLVLAQRGLVPAWFLGGLVVVDIALLLLLIWSFHIQYSQPAAFSLKAPTLLYLFLFIALRTLRFEPTYIVIAGASAALGWVVMVVYAITEPSLTSPVTRDYILYLTSNRILIGAEVDKVLSILVVTAVLALAIIRARRLLLRSVADAVAVRDLSRFVAPEVANQIAASDRPIQPGDAEVKEASILFCDIESFATLSEKLPPDVLMRLLNEYFAAMAEIIEQYDGVITAYQGDAMLIGFNTARPDPLHAAHALHAARDIQEMTARRRFSDGITLRTRCGVNTGTLVAGAVGTADRLLFTVYGDEVNVAARLEQLNKSFGTYVLASEQTLAAAGPDALRGCTFRPMGPVQVRGRRAPVSVFSFERPQPQPATVT